MPADLDDLLRRADPAAPMPARLPAALADDIVAGRRRRPRPMRLLPLTAAVAAATAAALVLAQQPAQRPAPVGPPAQSPPQAAITPAAFLRAQAAVAGRERPGGPVTATWRAWTPVRASGDGRPLLGVDVAEVTTTLEPDGAGSAELPYGAKVELYGPDARRTWAAAGRPRLKPWPLTIQHKLPGYDNHGRSGELTVRPSDIALGGFPSPREVAAVHDAAGLRRVLASGLASGSRFQWSDLVGLLAPGYRPEVRAAAYQLLAELPGLQVRPGAADPLGRRGTAVIVDDGDGLRHSFLIDPATSRLLGCEQVLTRRVPWAVAGPGTRVSAIALLRVRPGR